jgi:hypothetical protein
MLLATGRVCDAVEQLSRTVSSIKRDIKTDGVSAPNLRRLGLAYAHMGKDSDARVTFDGAIQFDRRALAATMDPNMLAPIHLSISQSFRAKGDLDEALASAEEGLQRAVHAFDRRHLEKWIRSLKQANWDRDAREAGESGNVLPSAASPVCTIPVLTDAALAAMSFQDGVLPTKDYQGTRDAYLSEHEPDAAFGPSSELRVDGDSPSDSGLDLVTLLYWDLSDMPAGAEIKEATITIHVHNRSGGSYEIYALSRNWSENSATWNNATTQVRWAEPGARGGSDRSDVVLGVINAEAKGQHAVRLNDDGVAVIQGWIDGTHFNDDGVAVIQGWIDGTHSNHGFLIADDQVRDGLAFSSREVEELENRPTLTLTYVPPPAEPKTGAEAPPDAVISTVSTAALSP